MVDTSAWIEYLRSSNHPLHFEVKELLHKQEAAWCGKVALELANFIPAHQQVRLDRAHQVAWMVEIDSFVWRRACKVTTAARRAGVTAPLTDIVVFTCAKIYDLEIVHKGDTDFGRLETVYASL
jgi:predicted nucleic acid-binding protein